MTILRNRSLVIIGLAESVSGIGNWITMLAVFAIVVFRGHGTVAQSSGIFLAGLLPTLVASPMAGWLCDRYDRKRLMIASELLDGMVVLGLIFVRQIEFIYLLLALQAVVMSIMTPARQAVVPDMVGPEKLTQANAFLQQLASLVKIGAPVLAGLVLAVLDPHQAIILDVVSFVLSALILTQLPALPPPNREQRQKGAEPGRSRYKSGAAADTAWQVLIGSGQLRMLFGATFLAISVIVGFDVLSAVITRDVLGGNEQLLGLMIALVGAGSAVAAALLMARGGRRDPLRDLGIGLALLACLPAGLALAARMGEPGTVRLVAMTGCLVGGLGNGLVGVQAGTLLQRASPPALLGRLGGLYQSTAIAGQLVGIIVTPLLVPALLPPATYFVLATGALAGVVLYLMYAVRRGVEAVAA